jgi:hypothetical protein
MAGVYKIEISESEAELKELLRKEKTGSGKERIQVLYLLKTKKAKTVTWFQTVFRSVEMMKSHP